MKKKKAKDDWDYEIADDMQPEEGFKRPKKKKNKSPPKDSNEKEIRDRRAELNPLKLPFTTGWGPLNEAILTNGHAVTALELLSNGYFDYQIAASFGVSVKTLYNWKEGHPELKKAWELGEAACHSFWTLRLQQMSLEGNEAGYKATMAILQNRFKYDWGQGASNNNGGTTSIQNISIQNMNVVKNMPTKDLVNNLNAQIDKFKALKILDADFKSIEMKPEELADEGGLLAEFQRMDDKTNE